MASPRRKRKGESDLSYALAMLNFHRFSDRIYGGGRKSRYQTDAEKRVLDLGGKIPPLKKRSPRRSFRDTLFQAQRNAAKLNQPNIKSNLSMQEQIDRQNKLYQQYLKDKKMVAPPRKGPVQRMPQRPSTLGKLFKGASTKPEGGFLKALCDSPMTKKPPPNQFKKFTPKKLVPKPGDPSKIPFGPTGKPLKKAKSPRQLERERIQKERDKILKARGPVKPTRQPSVTSRYRGGSGKKKYNQAAYFAGLGVNPNTKQNQGIYKPYANGGGVRKPKYKE